MKYLKSYKIFESVVSHVDEVIEECRDILLPIEDDLIRLHVYLNDSYLVRSRSNEEIVVIDVGDEYIDKIVDFQHYKDSFEHLFSYLKEQGFKLDKSRAYTSWKTSHEAFNFNSFHIDDFFDRLSKGSIISMSIVFSRQKYI